VQKLLYAVLMMIRKLKHYFLAHTVWVVYDRPLTRVLQSKEAMSWIAQWVVKIGQYDVEFIPRRTIKSQALTDFITEWTDLDVWGIGDLPNHWVMCFDGSYTLKEAGAGIVLIPPKGGMLKYAIQIEFSTTNNTAEYDGLVTGLRLGKELSIQRLLIRGDSQLMEKQVQKEYGCNGDKMADYLAEVWRMEKFFDDFEVRYVPHLDNRDVDHLAWIASSRASIPSNVIIEKLTKPSIKSVETLRETDLMIIDGAEQQPEIDWMSPVKTYLDNQPISDDNAEIERIAHKSKMYHLINGVLYKQGINGMMMKCIFKGEDIQLLREIHSGVCGAHSSQRSIVGKSFMHGFYWPTAKDDVMEIVTKYKECQFFQKQTTKHANP
jgi:ribonuclease HI